MFPKEYWFSKVFFIISMMEIFCVHFYKEVGTNSFFKGSLFMFQKLKCAFILTVDFLFESKHGLFKCLLPPETVKEAQFVLLFCFFPPQNSRLGYLSLEIQDYVIFLSQNSRSVFCVPHHLLQPEQT